MAQVAVLLMHVWECPDCPTILKARHLHTVYASSEFHMHRFHGVMVQWDPRIDLTHWAFNVVPDALRPPGSPGAVGTT